ncbi:sensor histidine kinase [Humitalea sp. 24SJ18S-53]|uniref:sensor histidine kinase n=1 Tax=Humitalea sp. 24SJ18S-53 TaxID=3422307 RepID=UPI003D66AC44
MNAAGPDGAAPDDSAPISFVLENLTPAAAALLLASPRRGAERQDTAVRNYAAAMADGSWVLNGIPIIVSRRGVLLDGMQRLLACIESQVPLSTFVARDVDDDVLHTIDQHRRRSSSGSLGAPGMRKADAQMALVVRLLDYEHLTQQAIAPPALSWTMVERLMQANPGLQEAVAASLPMAGSPLPEPVRTAILYMGNQVDRTKTGRLLAAVAHPDGSAPGEPGVALRRALDRAVQAGPRGLGRNTLFALAIKALNASLRGETLSQIAWNTQPVAGEPAEPFPCLDGYAGLAMPRADSAGRKQDRGPVPNDCTARFERIDQATATRYLATNIARRGPVQTLVAAFARDIAAGRWMRNAQPICFSADGRLINGQHRLMAVIASRGTIEVPVVRCLPEAAHDTYDIHMRRAPSVDEDTEAFGDHALAAAMANLLWRQERRPKATRAKKASAAEVRQILTEFPRLLGLRGFARRMLAFGRASVMGYGAFVIERDRPDLAPGFLKAIQTGADLPEGHPILALREALQRLRRDRAPQDDQLAALLSGWERFKAHAAMRGLADPGQQAAPAAAADTRPITLRTPAPGLPQGLADLRRRMRQQALIADYGAFALRQDDALTLMQEAARAAAEGLTATFAKVLEYDGGTDKLLLRAGVGARAPSPATDHRVKRDVAVVIGAATAPFGVLEVEDTRPGAFGDADLRYLEALANTLGLALARLSSAGAHAKILAERGAMLAEVRHRFSNGLQLVHMVLTLQAKAAETVLARDLLRRSAMRVITIAAVHRQLNQGERFETVEMAGYLHGLVGTLRTSLSGPDAGRSIALEVERGAFWPPQRAQMLGLVLGELLADAMAYGKGSLCVRFVRTQSGGQLELEDQESDRTAMDEGDRGIGIRMVAAMLQEQGGALSVVRGDAGSRILVAFPQLIEPA